MTHRSDVLSKQNKDLRKLKAQLLREHRALVKRNQELNKQWQKKDNVKQSNQVLQQDIKQLQSDIRLLKSKNQALTSGKAQKKERTYPELAIQIVAGPSLHQATNTFLHQLRTHGLPSLETSIQLGSAIFGRLVRVSIIGALIGLMPALMTIWQNILIGSQNTYLKEANQQFRAESQAARRAQLIATLYDTRCPKLLTTTSSTTVVEFENEDSPHCRPRASTAARLEATKAYLAIERTDEVVVVENKLGMKCSYPWRYFYGTFCENRELDLLFELRKRTNHLAGAQLQRVNASHLDFRGVILREVRLDGAHLDAVQLTKADLTDAMLVGTQLPSATVNSSNFRGANLKRASLRKAKGVSSRFEFAKLQHADFIESTLTKANFSGSRLDCIKFRKSKLHNAIFKGAKLYGAIFVKANLSGADFENASLQGAQFGHTVEIPDKELSLESILNLNVSSQDAIITHANFYGAKYDDNTLWPEGFDAIAAGAIKVSNRENGCD